MMFILPLEINVVERTPVEYYPVKGFWSSPPQSTYVATFIVHSDQEMEQAESCQWIRK